MSLVFLWALSACHSTRVVEAPPKPKPVPAVESPSPPLSADEMPPDQPDVPIEAPAEPPSLPPEAVPPKRPSKPKPEPQAPPAPSVPAAPGPIDAETKPLDYSVMTILGKKVQGAKGEDLGRVVDVLADAGGRVRIAVIEFGGFLGVGSRRIAVDWSLLRFNPDRGDVLTLSVSRKKLQSAPEYKNSAYPQALMAPEVPSATPAAGAADGKK
jgi:hypothetical protein